ncbi:MAG: 16S rRNA (uracil(1498)-N(3))-methyltransferase [Deltaproteobacteria bacterium]|nr:16S rRNA (uracil(1498)-N(3))-methyltransferase [Deltaproteobacteria bacterium]
MRRIVVSAEILAGNEVVLTGDPFHHLFRVLRMKSGDEVLLLDGQGGCCRCRIGRVESRRAALTVVERWTEEEKVIPIRLIQGLPKGDKFDFILQKGTEVGVSVFAPVIMERSVPLLKGENGQQRFARWRRIVDEAARQCRRPRVPEIQPLVDLASALEDGAGGLRLLCWEEGSRLLGEVLPGSRPARVTVLIGPEGGFTAPEVALALEAGYAPVRLGPRILRTETAGIVIAAWLQFLYGDMG